MKLPQSIPALVALGLCAAFACGVTSDSAERRTAAAPPAKPVPSSPAAGTPPRVRLTVRETAGVPRTDEVAQAGVPLPRAAGVFDPRTLAVTGADGRTVPADFRVLARWNAGHEDYKAPVQWLLVAFPASVEAKKSAEYQLVLDGSAGPNPAPRAPLRLTRQGDRITVDTGSAIFRLGGDAGALFDEVSLPDGKRLASGSAMTLETREARGQHSKVREVRVEHAGPLVAAVVVDGEYGLPAVGGGGFGSRRRYLFTAGSPTAIVRQAVAWEGNLACQGCLETKEGKPNGVLVQKVRDTLDLAPGPLDVTVVGERRSPAIERDVPAGQGAAVRQLLRPERSAPLRFEIDLPGGGSGGKEADGALLAAASPDGAVAIALRQMNRYEPQALRLLPGGQLAIDLADDKAWLAHHQGVFATFAVSALPGRPSRADLDRQVWAPLNRPLRPWADAAWFAGSQATPEFPAGPLPRQLAAYDETVSAVLRKTEESIASEGIAGLMTFGVYPRYWGRWKSPELSCKNDPTPGETWDDTFWCGTWTDYHNTVATAAIWAMRSGEVEWLDEIAFPGALRTLHTQIMQCGPGENWFYCGQAPAGYGGYRVDFNSSHAYFENLYLYYWLTGDSLVVDTLQRGGENMRRFMCESRGPQPVAAAKGPDGPACPPDTPLGHAGFTGRVAGQWTAAFRFLGLASDDPSFLEDFRASLARAVTMQYAELEKDGKRYGFLGGHAGGKGPTEAGPIWTNGFYDGENLYRLLLDTGDAPIGDPPVRPSQVLTAVARTLAEIEPTAQDAPPGASAKGGGDGDDDRGRGPGGGQGRKDAWPRLLVYTWEGPRIGGKLLTVAAKDRDLYGPEKAGTAALLVRAGRLSGDREILAAGESLALDAIRASRAEDVPLGKLQGQYLNRLHAAVAEWAAELAAEPSRPRQGKQ